MAREVAIALRTAPNPAPGGTPAAAVVEIGMIELMGDADSGAAEFGSFYHAELRAPWDKESSRPTLAGIGPEIEKFIGGAPVLMVWDPAGDAPSALGLLNLQRESDGAPALGRGGSHNIGPAAFARLAVRDIASLSARLGVSTSRLEQDKLPPALIDALNLVGTAQLFRHMARIQGFDPYHAPPAGQRREILIGCALVEDDNLTLGAGPTQLAAVELLDGKPAGRFLIAAAHPGNPAADAADLIQLRAFIGKSPILMHVDPANQQSAPPAWLHRHLTAAGLPGLQAQPVNSWGWARRIWPGLPPSLMPVLSRLHVDEAAYRKAQPPAIANALLHGVAATRLRALWKGCNAPAPKGQPRPPRPKPPAP